MRQRNGGAARSGPSQTRLTFSIDPVKAVQTDFTAEDPYQKVVKISPNGKFAATGGEDGIIRIWTFPEFNRVHEIENSHDKEIDDLDFSPDSTKVVSVSKDGTARVWDVAKGRRHAEMGWDSPGKLKFMYKRVRYGRIEGDDRKYKAYTISNPIGSRNPTAYLIRWNPKSYTLEQAAPFEGVLSALAVSDNGNFVATGSMTDGIVNIYTAFNLQRLKRVVKAHDSFITGLQFLPCGPEADAIRGFSDCSVVSISVDNKVCIHHIPRMSKLNWKYLTNTILDHFVIFFRNHLHVLGCRCHRLFPHQHLHLVQLFGTLNVSRPEAGWIPPTHYHFTTESHLQIS